MTEQQCQTCKSLHFTTTEIQYGYQVVSVDCPSTKDTDFLESAIKDRPCSKYEKNHSLLKISVDISNATSLPYGNEEHISSIYLRPEDITRLKSIK